MDTKSNLSILAGLEVRAGRVVVVHAANSLLLYSDHLHYNVRIIIKITILVLT